MTEGKMTEAHDLEAAIDRLEQAAAVWFNQDLHRALRTLIAAARVEESKRAATGAALEALERRIREKAE